MKNKLSLALVLFLLAISLLNFVGCSDFSKEPIVGTWVSGGGSFRFNPDGTMERNGTTYQGKEIENNIYAISSDGERFSESTFVYNPDSKTVTYNDVSYFYLDYSDNNPAIYGKWGYYPNSLGLEFLNSNQVTYENEVYYWYSPDNTFIALSKTEDFLSYYKALKPKLADNGSIYTIKGYEKLQEADINAVSNPAIVGEWVFYDEFSPSAMWVYVDETITDIKYKLLVFSDNTCELITYSRDYRGKNKEWSCSDTICEGTWKYHLRSNTFEIKIEKLSFYGYPPFDSLSLACDSSDNTITDISGLIFERIS